MNKRGLSGMVVTLLLILLAIAASIIIWSFIKVAISDQSEISQAKSRFFTEVMIVNKVTINQTNPSNLKVLITRKSGKTTAAFYLQENLNKLGLKPIKLAFADPAKERFCKANNIGIETLYLNDLKEVYREQ
ncbi:MAG: hypothetical protein UU77_C0015G0018, partial [candidate division WWE3 bacterium GW2011_GWC1_41_7]